ncbi:MAG: hypothetical protein WCD86_18190 [Ktedonobacteraceae bacterium]
MKINATPETRKKYQKKVSKPPTDGLFPYTYVPQFQRREQET